MKNKVIIRYKVAITRNIVASVKYKVAIASTSYEEKVAILRNYFFCNCEVLAQLLSINAKL